MAKSLNRVTILGHVGRAPEVKQLSSGSLVVNFSVATSYKYKTREGDYKESTEWHNVVAYGRLAEIVRDYVQKGSKLYAEGRLQTRSWDDRDSGKKQYRTEIVADDVTLCGGGNGAGRQSDAAEPGYSYDQQPIQDDDIPF